MMQTAVIGVYSCGGHGREVMPLIRAQFPDSRVLFIDDTAYGASVNGHEVLDWTSFTSLQASEHKACIAIGSSAIRQRLAEKCETAGIALVEARASNVIQLDDVVIGPGACLSPFVSLMSNIRIGRCFHANIYSSVSHDCVIGDYVTFAPRVTCNGNIHIHDHAYIGAGAVIRQGTPEKPLVIGEGAIVGMGAVVTRDVPARVTVVGNPARPMVKS